MLEHVGAMSGEREFYTTLFAPGCLFGLRREGNACDAVVLLCRETFSDGELHGIAKELAEGHAHSILLYGPSYSDHLYETIGKAIKATWATNTHPPRMPFVNLEAPLPSELHMIARMAIHMRCGKEKITVVLIVGNQENYASMTEAIRRDLSVN